MHPADAAEVPGADTARGSTEVPGTDTDPRGAETPGTPPPASHRAHLYAAYGESEHLHRGVRSRLRVAWWVTAARSSVRSQVTHWTPLLSCSLQLSLNPG
jgi:hypothetical protein